MHISQQEKEKFLISFGEEEFRDRVVRRLFKALGFQDGRDLCGPEENGKDVVFVDHDKFGEREFTAVQTKVGNVNLSGDPSKNLHVIITQLQTALQHPYTCVRSKSKKLPRTVYLIASGRINNQARDYIAEAVRDPRIKFLDRDDLIDAIDQKAPEVWSGIVADISPYLRALAEKVESLSVNPGDANPIQSSIGAFVAASDDRFVEMRLDYYAPQVSDRNGRVEQSIGLEEIRGSTLFNKGSVRALLLGEAGSGKSTLLVRLAYMIAKASVIATKNYRVPLVIRAHELVGSVGTIYEALSRIATSTYRLSKAPFDLDDFEAGRVILMIDGLDELSDSSDRQEVVNFCTNIIESYPKCSLALATRPYSSIERLAGLERFKRYRISPLSLEDASKMLEVVENASGRVDATWRKEVLRKLEGVHGIELNPLLVTVFAVSAGFDKRDVPANITELFSKFAELMLGRWDEKKGLAHQYQAKVKDKIISEFAYKVHCQGTSEFTRSEFVEFSSTVLRSIHLEADINVVVDEMLNRSGLFRGDEELEFRHHLLQEYFASRGIPNVDFVKSVIDNDWWRNAIVFYFGGRPESVDDLLDVATSGIAEESSFIAIGLALQACYLSKIEDRIEVWKWVDGGAAKAALKWLTCEWSGYKYPITSVLEKYLEARDALPLLGIDDHRFSLPLWCVSNCDGVEGELRLFWYAVGLAELGEFRRLIEIIESGVISSPVLLTAIHFGCFFAEQVRALPEREIEAAKQICELLGPQVASLRQQIAEEFKGQLLEYREGGVVALDQSEPA